MPSWAMESHARAAPYPQRLKHLADLQRWDSVVQQWGVERRVRLDSEQARIVAGALIRARQPNSALDVAVSIDPPDLDLIEQSLVLAREMKEGDVYHRAGEILIRRYVGARNWRAAVAVASGASMALGQDAHLALLRSLVQWLAVSDGLSNSHPEEQRIVTEFLRTEVVALPSIRQHISPIDLGAAIERAGRHIDAVTFYENVSSNQEWACDDIAKRFARGRWFVSKEKLSRTSSLQRHRQDMLESAANLRLSQEQLGLELRRLPYYPRPDHPEESFLRSSSEFPKVADVVASSPGPAKPETQVPKVETQVPDGKFELRLQRVVVTARYLPSKRRLNLTADGLVCLVRFDGETFICESEDLQILTQSSSEWIVESWGLHILALVTDQRTVRITLRDTVSEEDLRILNI